MNPNEMNIVKKFENDILNEKIHPSSQSAYMFLKSISIGDFKNLKEIIKTNADKGSEIGKVNLYSLERFLNGEELTDLHIIGLAWTINAIVTEIQIEETAKKLRDAMMDSTKRNNQNNEDKKNE